MQAPLHEHWFELTDEALDLGAVYEWCVLPSCGAVVVFSGTVRDHADGRSDVTHLEYHAYDEMVIARFSEIAERARADFDEVGRIAILHRTGTLSLGESSVVVGVSAAHRDQAFGAARFAIDALKASAPIWKKEIWSGGADWGTRASTAVPVDQVDPAAAAGLVDPPTDPHADPSDGTSLADLEGVDLR